MTDSRLVTAPSQESVSAARLWAASRFPYLASALFALDVMTAPGIGTATVDDRWRLSVDPDAAAAWSTPQLGSLLVHHVTHLLRDHAARARQRGVEEAEAARWLRAADAEINDDLVAAGLEQPGTVVLPEHFDAEPGRFAEEYFDQLDGKPIDAGAGCGSGADGIPRSWEHPAGGGLSEYAAHLLGWHTAREMLEHAREAGSVPAGWRRWAEGVVQPTIDWRVALAAELRRGVAEAAGAVDYSYSRPSRRAAAAAPAILPSLRAPMPNVAAVCDTSGSISDRQLARVLGELDGILRAVGVRQGAATVLAVDSAVHAVRRATRTSHVDLVGGGGTDMGAGIRAACDLRPAPSMVVVLTDGHTPWPAERPGRVPVVVGLLDGAAPDPPAWARSVRIPGEP